MYNNGRVAAIHYNSFRQISNTEVYPVYEAIACRKKNERIRHYQAIVKGPPCPTNITTPGQNQHVPQAMINHLFLQKHVIRILTTSMMNMMMMKIYLQIYAFHQCKQDQRMLLIFATSKHLKKRNCGLSVQ